MRLAFAVASHLEPEILLVDEVLAVGDAAFQKKCLGKMGKVASEGRTILFVSHNLTAIKTLCDRALWLENGIVTKSGNAEQVVLDYLQTGAISTHERFWEDASKAPGNETMKIRSARIRSLGKGNCGEFSVEEALLVDFEFWNYQPDVLLNFTMHLMTIEGLLVFAASSDMKPMRRGLLKESVRIPANFLNNDVYAVSIQVVQDGSFTLFAYPEVLVFEVQDTVRTGNWFGKWPGVIRPKLEWSSDSIPEDEGIK